MLVHLPLHVPSELVTEQLESLEQKTVFTHSEGFDDGDCEG